MSITTIALSCRFADRLTAARFAVRATRRAGTPLRRAISIASGLLLHGRAAELPLRSVDAARFPGCPVTPRSA